MKHFLYAAIVVLTIAVSTPASAMEDIPHTSCQVPPANRGGNMEQRKARREMVFVGLRQAIDTHQIFATFKATPGCYLGGDKTATHYFWLNMQEIRERRAYRLAEGQKTTQEDIAIATLLEGVN